jgi:hypothetical protein
MTNSKQDTVEHMYKSIVKALKTLKRIKETLQQLKYRPALRISRPEESPLPGSTEKQILEQLRLISAEFARLGEADGKSQEQDTRPLLRTYADLGTSWWRLARKMLRPGTDRPLDEMKGIFTFVESLRDVIEELGIQVIDHTGKEIPQNLSLEVLAYQEKPGLTKDRVSETVRPTVYYKDRMIQMGRVYVDTPVSAGKSASKASA